MVRSFDPQSLRALEKQRASSHGLKPKPTPAWIGAIRTGVGLGLGPRLATKLLPEL